MSASMQIDQVGIAAGTPGLARTDGLDDGATVTLTSITVGTTYRFEFLWVPSGDTTAVASLAATGSPEIWEFSPTPNVYGTYRIRLIVDEGLPTEDETIRVFGIRNSSGLLSPAFNEKADEGASLVLHTPDEVEGSENNEVSGVSGLQWTGWHDFFTLTTNLLDTINRTRYIKQAFNEQEGITPSSVGAWKLKQGTLKAGSSVYFGSSTGTHTVTARLRRVGDPVPIVAQWQTTSGLSNVNLASDATLPADDWYYLEIFSGDAAAVALLDGVDFVAEQDAP